MGGNNILPMKELREVLATLGLSDVKTYIQSGNVVFQSKKTDIDDLTAEISAAIGQSFGFTPHLLLLTMSEFQNALTCNPFPEGEAEPKTLHLFFLATIPNQPNLDSLTAVQTDSEKFSLIDKVFYLYAPEGIGRSKLAAKVEKAMDVATTARNWRSVNKIMGMAADL